VFSNLNWTNIVILLLLALFIFGDKLPHILGDGLRLLRKLRRMATDATSDLSRELGTDIRLEDLHPKTFIRKHVLNDVDHEALLEPLKGISNDIVDEVKGIERDFKGVSKGGPTPQRRVSGASGANGADSATAPSATTPAAEPSTSPAARSYYDDIT
jgi:sec-independent protein translocase protein TatB